ncbi:hypothetical protein V1527DRAFT_463407 [Lipomyces starkeyi]
MLASDTGWFLSDVTAIHPRRRFQATLPDINVHSQHIDTSTLSIVKDPSVGIPRMGCPKGRRRLQRSAEVFQIPFDRIEKVGRCGSCR